MKDHLLETAGSVQMHCHWRFCRGEIIKDATPVSPGQAIVQHLACTASKSLCFRAFRRSCES